jgi:hypothetical protein
MKRKRTKVKIERKEENKSENRKERKRTKEWVVLLCMIVLLEIPVALLVLIYLERK